MSSHLIVNKSYLAPLEGWRGVLALCVVSFHFSKLFFDEYWTPFGYLGVDFFFVLSGFIIARQYEASIAMHTVDFRTFAIRRLARLYPLYIITIGAALLINFYMIDPYSPLRINDFGIGPSFIAWIFVQLTMLGSLTQMAQPNGPVWSVSAEWVVNLAFFALVWRYRRIPNTLLWFIILVGASYLIAVSPYSLETPTHGIPIARSVVGFTFGWVIFRYHLFLPRVPLLLLYSFEIILLWVTLWFASSHTQFLQYGVDLAFALVLIPLLITVSLYRNGLICFIFSRFVMTYLGRISYSIYLIHYPLTYFMVHTPSVLALGYPGLGIAYVVTLIGISTLSYLFIEKPFRWVGRQLSRRRPVATTGTLKPA